MSAGQITELRLTEFKSFADVRIPIDPLTLLIGRNGSGKSNALDALEVISRLAKAEDVRDALEGNRRDAASVRGGVEGCAPHGKDNFEVGVSLVTETGQRVSLDVCIQVRPDLQIVSERLCGDINNGWHTLLDTADPDPHGSDISASVHNGRRGPNPRLTFRSSHLLTTQLQLRLAGKTVAERGLLDVVDATLAVLSGVFHLDPVPHLMRQYVPESDVVLRRTAENLSAAVARLKRDDKQRFNELVRVVADLPEHEVRSIDVGKGGFGEVMLALKERKGRESVAVPARQMSDGMLRVLAIATALLTGGGGVAIDATVTGRTAPLMLVIEELENGLHPTQANRLLDLVKKTQDEQGFQLIVTTHSPALLNALAGEKHHGVVVIDRDGSSGSSRARRLVDLPGYTRMMAGGRLGDAVTAGRLPEAAQEPRISEHDIDQLLGAG